MEIGFIGLGQMGSGIAQNLMSAGHRVTIWNRSPAAMAPLVAKGAIAASSAADALQGELLFSMLASDAAYRGVGLDGALLDKAAAGLTHVNMATISVALARELAAAHATRDIAYVAAPVFGRPDAAAQAQLVIVAAGDANSLARLEPLFAAIGRRTVIVGMAPEKANLFKIAGNFMIVGAMETMAQAFALLKKGDVDPVPFHAVLTEGLFAGVVFQRYGKMMLEDAYEPAGFALALGLKDVNLAREAAAELGMAMPLAEMARDHYDEAVALGWSDKDWSALGALIAKKAGV